MNPLYDVLMDFLEPFIDLLPSKDAAYMVSSIGITAFTTLLCSGISALWGCLGAFAALGKRR